MLPLGPLRSTKGIAVAQADGIGSSRVSQEASAAAVRGFLDDYYATSDAWSVRRSAQRVLAATNAWLHAQTMRSHARFDKDRGYVCTFSALILKGREVHLLHVGDTRIYRLHAQALEQLTEDHRVHLSSVRVLPRPGAGRGPNVEIDYRCLAAEVGEIYLLATDGAYAHLDAAAVHDALARCADDFDAAAAALVASARARGATTTRRCSCCASTRCPTPTRCTCRRSARDWHCRRRCRPAHELRGLHPRARTPCQRPQPRAPGRRRRDRAAGGAEDAFGRPARRPGLPRQLPARGMGGAAHRTARTCSRPAPATGRAGMCTSRWSSWTARRWHSG